MALEFEIFTRPMSVNRYYATTRTGQFHTTNEGKAYKEGIRAGLAELGEAFTKFSGFIKLDIQLKYGRKRRLDVDNCLKPLLDSLEGYLYDNDSQIYQLSISKSFGHQVESLVLKAEAL